MRAIKKITVCLALSATIPVAYAAPNVPDSASASRLEKQLRLPEPPPAVQAPAAPTMPKPLEAPQGAQQTQVTLTHISLENSTIYTQAELAPLLAPYLNKTITLADLYTLANQLTAHYRNDGYLLSRVIIPPQRIANGQLTLQAVEGYIDQVHVEPVQGTQAAFVSPMMHTIGQALTQERPLTAKTLERQLLLLNRLPGIKAESVIEPSQTTPGAASVTIRIQHTAKQGFWQVDNRGSKFAGPIQAQTQMRLNGVFSEIDQLALRLSAAAQPSELQFVELRHQLPLTASGLLLRTNANLSRSNPAYTLKSFDVVNNSASAGIGVSYPVKVSRSENLTVTSDLTLRDSSSSSLGTMISEDRVRTLAFGLDYDKADRFRGLNQLHTEIAQGIGIFNASQTGDPTSRAKADPRFTRFNLDLSRTQHLGGNWSVLGAISTQLSEDPLPASEEFGIGGSEFGQAYDASEITGDSGAAAKVELRYSNQTGFITIPAFEAYGFYDTGVTVNHDPASGEKARRTLASMGVGVRLPLPGGLGADLQFAKPLTRPVSAMQNVKKRDEPRFFFNIGKSF